MWLTYSLLSVLRCFSKESHQSVALSKSKVFADNNSNVNQKLKFVLGRVKNIVGRGENAGCHCFLLFPQCF